MNTLGQSDGFTQPHLKSTEYSMTATADDKRLLNVAILAFAVVGIYASYLTQVRVSGQVVCTLSLIRNAPVPPLHRR